MFFFVNPTIYIGKMQQTLHIQSKNNEYELQDNCSR